MFCMHTWFLVLIQNVLYWYKISCIDATYVLYQYKNHCINTRNSCINTNSFELKIFRSKFQANLTLHLNLHKNAFRNMKQFWDRKSLFFWIFLQRVQTIFFSFFKELEHFSDKFPRDWTKLRQKATFLCPFQQGRQTRFCFFFLQKFVL